MNKVLSQVIKRAVSEYSAINNSEINKEKRPDLFSLNNETELFQNSKGITLKIDRSRDKILTGFGKATLGWSTNLDEKPRNWSPKSPTAPTLNVHQGFPRKLKH